MRRIRTTIDAKSLPAAALSAYVDEESRRVAFEVGFQEHLSKPVEPARLVSILAKLAHHNAT
jgi:CheY-like chemotaxis protein